MKSNEQYISLYDYSGNATRLTGIGKKVYEAAKEKGIHVIYTDLPEERSTPEYNRVATYPKSFLDEYFGKTTTPVELDIAEISNRLIALEEKFNNLIQSLNVTNTIESVDDDLPF